ncbi:Hint domain-containing protein [Jannaschia pohangensis]|uniref:Hint domain-containing protein n=1 Tax=Jannaschia pohangensis TaxID=390807 RepID=A0A1I3NL70_9RHOB|nr:Hint domain-containing protein [Jannaschia pohangensis]SFJ09506.1 Hint domain-containing protein [Jannaschia pohangensis]
MPTSQFYIYDAAALPYNASNGTFTFDPNYNFRDDRVLLEITDDDAFLDGDEKNNEVGEDANQTGTATRPDGTLVASGKIYGEEYAILRAPDGTTIYIDRIEIRGQHIGYSPSQPLQPGVTYTFIGGDDIDNSLLSRDGADTRMTYAEYEAQSVACFAPGTRIETAGGAVPVEWLRPGDQVVTLDGGPLPVRWVGGVGAPNAPAFRIAAGALPGQPQGAALVVSPHHRLLLRSGLGEMMFGVSEVFAAARHLLGLPGVTLLHLPRTGRFHHLLLDRHCVVRANGIWTESLFLGDNSAALAGLSVPGDLCCDLSAGHRRAARRCLRAAEAQALIRSETGHRLFPQEAGRRGIGRVIG